MLFRFAVLSAVLGSSVFMSTAFAANPIAPRVPTYERFYAAPLPKPDDEDEEPITLDPVTGGRLLLTELNCTSCHTVSGEATLRLTAKQAPILDDAGTRIKVEWLRDYLASPHQVKPGTTMPDLISTLPEADRAGSVEALTHFLASTGAVTEARPDSVAGNKGLAIFRKVGCLACHNSQDENAPSLTTSVPLPDLNKKYSALSLAAFLKDPLKSRPAGRMPAMGLSDEEYRNLAHHFVRDGNSTPNMKFALYQVSATKLPNFDELKPVMEGETVGFDPSIAGRANDFGLRFTTYLKIVRPGDYHFWLGSDDGSKLTIDDTVVVDCDGVHPHSIKDGHMRLSAGFHKVLVEYFQGGGESSLEVELAGRELARQPLTGWAYLEPKEPVAASPHDKPVFAINSDLVTKGRELFGSIGCAACHQLKIDGQPIISSLTARPLAELATMGGCLADRPATRIPNYDLSPVQRSSLAAAIKAPASEAPAESIHRTMSQFNCYACHLRDKLGGVEAARDRTFESLQKEMGDEGRLPPALTGVGDKLRPDWLRHVLHNSADDRKNYMVTKMPKFGPNNVEPLVSLFGSVDMNSDPTPKADFTDPEYRVKAMGRHLVGGQALSCIKCHDFGPYPSTGIRAVNMTSMNQRLRPEWFYRYVLDPQEYRRGTRMPSAWPSGQTTMRDVLHGNVNQQVQAVWLYLSDRDKAAVPPGLIREPIELKPQSEPILYRNFIEGAGARAIGVGYPEAVNLAFDANEMRLAMIWHGAFIDASRHWTGRGQGFEPPLGDDILMLPPNASFQRLDSPNSEFATAPARDAGYKFLGYRLDARQRPLFRYSLPGFVIEDQPIPNKREGQTATLNRSFSIEGQADGKPLWYRAIVAKQLETLGEGRYRVDGSWTTAIEPSDLARSAVVRESAGKQELLVPIRPTNGKAAFVQRYEW